MRQGHGIFRGFVALLFVALAVFAGPAAAQDEIRQLKLTEPQVLGFIAAQKDLAEFAEKLQAAGDQLDEKLQGELNEIATKHGFKDFTELDDVAANISIVLAGIDPQTNEFVDPQTSLKAELEEVKGDETIAADEKKALIEELEEAIRATPPLEHQENIALVAKHREAIEKALE